VIKKMGALLLTLLFMTTAAFAASSIPEIVYTYIPQSAQLTESEFDDGCWEYEFRDGDIRYDLLLKDGVPLALTIDYLLIRPSKENTLSQEAIAAAIPGEILYAKAEKDDGRWSWKVIARQDQELFEYDLNAENGQIIEMEQYFGVSLELPEGSYRSLDLEWDDGLLGFDID